MAPARALALLAAVELPQGLVSDGARLIETQPEQLHGANEALPSAVATGLETRHLLAGNLCLRAMIEVVLDLAQAGYTHTLGQLDSCRRLASANDDWGRVPPHNAYARELLPAYGLLIGFLKKLNFEALLLPE